MAPAAIAILLARRGTDEMPCVPALLRHQIQEHRAYPLPYCTALQGRKHLLDQRQVIHCEVAPRDRQRFVAQFAGCVGMELVWQHGQRILRLVEQTFRVTLALLLVRLDPDSELFSIRVLLVCEGRIGPKLPHELVL